MINNTNLVVIIEPANSRKQNINFNLSSPLYQTLETHTHTHTHTHKQTGFNLEKRIEIIKRFLETVPVVLSLVS